MAYGMTYSEYWDGTPELATYYRQAARLKQKQKNYELWLQGLYVYEAIADIAPILVFGAKRGTKIKEYSREPYVLTEREHKEREIQAEKERQEKFKLQMAAWAAKFNQRIKEKNGG